MPLQRKAWKTNQYDERMLRILGRARNSGITVAQIAEKSEISIPTLLGILRGQKQASPECLRLLELVIDQFGAGRIGQEKQNDA